MRAFPFGLGAAALILSVEVAEVLAQPTPTAAAASAPSAPVGERLAERAPAQETAAIEQGLAFFKQRQFQAAAQWLEVARRSPTLNPEVLLMLGVCYYRLGDFQRAEPPLRQAVREGDTEVQASARVFLGLLFGELGAVDEARNELSRVTGSPALRESAQNLLRQNRPHRLLFTFAVSPEYDGNVPLIDYTTWSANPQASADGDMLFLASISARPLAVGLIFGDILSYRQQFQQSAYNLLLNSTWLGYNHLGVTNRIRTAVTLQYAMLGESTLFIDVEAKASYRRQLISKLGLSFAYDGHYRDYLNSDFVFLSGFTHTLQTELGWGLGPHPFGGGLGYQAIREQTREPTSIDPSYSDFRAWVHGPMVWMRARLHERVELAAHGTFLHRIFDYVPGPELPDEQGIRRVDYMLNGDLSLSFTLTSWLEFFVGSSLIYNDSNKPAFLYFKPSAYLGLAAHLGLL